MFQLHPTLARDSLPIAETADTAVRLINDARYPWVLVIPKAPGLRDLHDLDSALFVRTMDIVRRIGAQMKSAFSADKINTAALGNIVPQLHVHVIARRTDDAAWPSPVWGVGTAEPLDEAEAKRRIGLIAEAL